MIGWRRSELRGIFGHLSDDQLEKLTTIIVNKVNAPLDSILFLMDEGLSQYKIDGKIDKILAIALPSLQDVSELRKLWETDSLREKVCQKLSLKQYELLLTDWQANVNAYQVFYYLQTIFKYHKPTPEFVELCMKLGIDVDKLLHVLNGLPYGHEGKACLPRLCGAYAVNILNSQESQDVKQAKILGLIELLSPFIDRDLDNDDCYQFARLLVEYASADQFAILLPCFAKASDNRRQRLADAAFHTLFEGIKPDHEKIKQAFTAYWPIWKEFDIYQRPWAILLFIDSEEIMKIGYEAAPDRLKAEIREYFGKALQQDVINRVIN